MTEGKIEITRLDETNNAALHCQYGGQSQPQDCYLELDLDAGTLRADYNGEIGNAVPFNVWHGRTIRFGIPAGTLPAEANRLMDEILDDAQIVLDNYTSDWDGSNHVGRLDAAAWDNRSEMDVQRGDSPAETPGQDARDAIEAHLEDEAANDMITCLRVEDCAEWFSYDHATRDGHKDALRKGMSDADLETQIESDTDDSDGPVVLESVDSYIEQLREEIEDEQD